jgi:hypothetical protein
MSRLPIFLNGAENERLDREIVHSARKPDSRPESQAECVQPYQVVERVHRSRPAQLEKQVFLLQVKQLPSR